MIIQSLQTNDHIDWLGLWKGYVNFYQASVSDTQTQLTWQRILDANHPLQGFAVVDQNKVIGFAHCFMHGSTWSDCGYCYLEDLFVDPAGRGRGVARQLIEHVGAWAAHQGADKLYWLTKENNYAGRMLYDKVAKRSGFIHYERPMS